jgi:hypothetical protein
MDRSHIVFVHMLERAHFGVFDNQEELLGLISARESCIGRFSLPPRWCVRRFLGGAGSGFLTLKLDPNTSLVLSDGGVPLATVRFDRPVRVSSAFPRRVAITRCPTTTRRKAGPAIPNFGRRENL